MPCFSKNVKMIRKTEWQCGCWWPCFSEYFSHRACTQLWPHLFHIWISTFERDVGFSSGSSLIFTVVKNCGKQFFPKAVLPHHFFQILDSYHPIIYQKLGSGFLCKRQFEEITSENTESFSKWQQKLICLVSGNFKFDVRKIHSKVKNSSVLKNPTDLVQE